MGAARRRDARLGSRRGGLLLTRDAQARTAWLDRGSNRAEWERLRAALELAEGFSFFCVQTGDRLAQRYLGELLAGLATSEALALAELELGERTTVADVLAWLRATPRPALLWIHRADEGAELGQFFALLNQKRDVISTLADSPFVVALHPNDWGQFRGHAPDFWSIHQIVCRFSPGREPIVSRASGRERRPGEARATASGWRLAADEIADLASPTVFGRESEINFLIAALASPGARVLVHGRAGAGKTTLLRQVVPRISARYPDGVWWIPFESTSGARTREVLAGLVNELIPSGEQRGDLSRLFRGATAAMDALFIFEDVEDPAAVEALIPGERAAMIVTTRLDRSPLEGFDVLGLGGLSVEAGAKLLRARTELDVETARRVAATTDGHASYLTLSAAILADNPDSAAQIMAELAGDGDAARLDADIDAAIERVLARRSPAARELWPRLGLFRGTFNCEDVAAVAEAEAEPMKIPEVLVELGRVGLIETTVAPDEYRFFPLLRATAERRLEQRGDADAARLAHARRILAGRRAPKVDPDVHAAVDWLREALAREATLTKAVADIIDAALPRWKGADAAAPVMELALEVASSREHLHDLVEIQQWFGRAALQRGELDGAEAWFGRAFELAEQLDDAAARAAALVGLGDVERERDDPSRALLQYQAAIGEGAGDARAQAFGRAGDMAMALAEPEAAERYYRGALEAAGDSGERASAYRGLAVATFVQGDYDRGEALAHEALAANDELGDQARAYAILGAILDASGRYLRSASSYQESLAAYERLGDLPNVANIQRQLGDLAATTGDLETARRWYEESLRLAARINDDSAVARTCVSLAELAIAQGELEQAVAALARSPRPEPAEVRAALLRCHESAPALRRPRLRAIWTDAGHEWPGSAQTD